MCVSVWLYGMAGIIVMSLFQDKPKCLPIQADLASLQVKKSRRFI